MQNPFRNGLKLFFEDLQLLTFLGKLLVIIAYLASSISDKPGIKEHRFSCKILY